VFIRMSTRATLLPNVRFKPTENVVGPRQMNYLSVYHHPDISSKGNRDDNKILITVVITVAAILLVINLFRQNTNTSTLASSCTANGGTWVADYDECEWISEKACTELGGTFNECDSACRHESEPVACTLNCVAICSF
jgi:hypothetical protein